MGNQINEQQQPKKRRSVARPADLGNRVTALENSNEAHHGEMMRMLADMSISMREGFKGLAEEVKHLAIKQVEQDGRIEATNKEISRVDSKLSRVMGGIGALAIALVGGLFTVLARYMGVK